MREAGLPTAAKKRARTAAALRRSQAEAAARTSAIATEAEVEAMMRADIATRKANVATAARADVRPNWNEVEELEVAATDARTVEEAATLRAAEAVIPDDRNIDFSAPRTVDSLLAHLAWVFTRSARTKDRLPA